MLQSIHFMRKQVQTKETLFQAYVSPYRKDLKDGQCILCLKFIREDKKKAAVVDAVGNGETTLCTCPSATKCEGCKVRGRVSPYAI